MSYLPATGGVSGILNDSLEVFDPSTGQTVPIQQEVTAVRNESFTIEAEADYEFFSGLSGGLGVGVMIDLTGPPYAQRKLISLPNLEYPGSDKDVFDLYSESEDSYNSLIPYLSIDLAYRISLNRDWDISPEVRYLFPFLSPITSSSWNPSLINAYLGVTYKL
jgi:hypothetical protein